MTLCAALCVSWSAGRFMSGLSTPTMGSHDNQTHSPLHDFNSTLPYDDEDKGKGSEYNLFEEPPFFSFENSNFRTVLFGVLSLVISAFIVGIKVYYRKKQRALQAANGSQVVPGAGVVAPPAAVVPPTTAPLSNFASVSAGVESNSAFGTGNNSAFGGGNSSAFSNSNYNTNYSSAFDYSSTGKM